MTPLIDDVTAAIILVQFVLMAIVMFDNAYQRRMPWSWVITGIAALMVAGVYAMPVLFNVPVVEIRGAFRLSLIVYAFNYLIVHYDVFVRIIKKIKTWNFHRS